MTRLLFVRTPKVYLPEVAAYRDYLSRHCPNVSVFDITDLPSYNAADYDILWRFMGMDLKARGNMVVHEYNSLSAPPYAHIKNTIKKATNGKPDMRVFLNARVRDVFGFRDNLPAYCRDMGVDTAFFNVTKVCAPKYDFVFAGGLDRGPVITKFLDHFANTLKGMTLLLVGDVPEHIKQKYKDCSGVIFHGRVPYRDVPSLLAQSRYGLNIMPDVFPFNIQTATKVLEYCALGLPVITTDYPWIRDFEAQHNAALFKLDSDMGNLTREKLEQFTFKIPDMMAYEWGKVIEKSGIFSFLTTGKS
jgi:glycosyltransferase involved in cell wall biosynthesis